MRRRLAPSGFFGCVFLSGALCTFRLLSISPRVGFNILVEGPFPACHSNLKRGLAGPVT